MGKYFVGYRYDRRKKELRSVQDQNGNMLEREVSVQFSSYSSDVVSVGNKIKTLEDIQALELQIFNNLKPELEIRDQEIIGLLVMGLYELEE